jgi:hypothetical protein
LKVPGGDSDRARERIGSVDDFLNSLQYVSGHSRSFAKFDALISANQTTLPRRYERANTGETVHGFG